MTRRTMTRRTMTKRTMTKRTPLIYLASLFVLAALLTILVQPEGRRGIEPPAAVAFSPKAIPDLQGTWAGTWRDTVFAVSGDLTFVIWGDGIQMEATGDIDITEINPGLGVLSGSATGTGDGDVLNGSFNCTSLGTGSGTLTSTALRGASAAGSGSVTAPLNFGPFLFTGWVDGDHMGGTFSFLNPGSGAGNATLTRTTTPAEANTWSDIKALYR